MEQATIEESVLDKIMDLPPELIMACIFLIFLFQIIKFGADFFYRMKKEKVRKQDVTDNNGVNHLTIFEKLGEHNALLERVDDNLDKVTGSMNKLENDFRLHTQSDADMANNILTRLNTIDSKL